MPRIKIVSLLLLAGMLLTVLCACTQKVPDDETGGLRIGVCTGTIFDTVVENNLDRPLVSYFNSNSDLALALEKGKIDGYVIDEPIARLLAGEYPDHCVSRKFADEEYAFAFKKGGRESERLCGQMNAFLEECRRDGTIERLDEIWFGQEESLKTVDMSGLTAENGTLVFSTTTDAGAPFSYVKDNRLVGYDIDIAVRFCREYGYGIEIVNNSFAGLIADISAGKSDFAGACITITAERSEKMLFSDANYVGGSVLVTKGTAPQAEEGGYDFFRSVGESFQKTFIREERYLLFLRGIGTTLLVVALSLVFGTVLGFAVYLAYYRAGRGFRRTVDLVIRVIDDTPVVVILMILYYLVFGSVDISGTAVSVIGFTMIFTGSVIGVMKVGVGAVDAGQREAALALGYSENKAFMKLILPQAAVHFLPGYKSAIVQLIKGTAIVGYIAVQDLTKVSDIVRSRTYEAFFPLIVTALLYFLFAAAISLLIKRLEINVDPASRKRIRLLRGVKTK